MTLRIAAIVFMLGYLPLYGQNVSRSELIEMADQFMRINFPDGQREILEITPFHYDDLNTLNLIEVKPDGWLLLSADRKIEPVIGFSFTGKFEWPGENIQNPMYNWIRLYQEEIKHIISDKFIKDRDVWALAKESSFSKGTTATRQITVNPFMLVNWGQGSSWNRFCPVDPKGPGGRVYVGCVAVSMAQAMSIFKIPSKGQGSHSYNLPLYGTQYANFGNTDYFWSLMSPDRANDYNALLLYHSAVSVNMNFGADGSGAQTSSIESALKKYFLFSQKILYKRRTGTNQEWHELLIKQLTNGRPIVYAGDADDGESGHAFNIDGVLNSTYFHINWGWTGFNNGYFTLDALNPEIYNFNKNQAAILGIQPFYYPTDIILSDTLVREKLPAGTVIGRINVTDEAGDNVYNFKLKCDSNFIGSGWIKNYVLDGDVIKTGRIFTSSDKRIDTVIISLTDKYNNRFIKSLPLKIVARNYIANGSYPAEREYFLFPNPVDDKLYFDSSLPSGLSKINIYSLTGKKVRAFNIHGIIDGISVHDLKSGFYILEALFEDQTILRQKFIKK
jgi:hypothetical protein